MDKISLLKTRKEKQSAACRQIMGKINAIIDAQSFVELDGFSYSHNDFYGEDVLGEGVVTGYATVNCVPCYMVGINPEVLCGGLSKAGCDKIVKCLDKAMVAGAPVVYLVSSEGILAGEGVDVLEGVAGVLAKMNELSDNVPQFAVASGKVLGMAAMIFAQADYTYYLNGACVAYASPLVIAAKSNQSLDEEKIGGATNGNGLCSFVVEDMSEVKDSIVKILDVLPDYNGISIDFTDDPNRCCEVLNLNVPTGECLLNCVFDNSSAIVLNGNVESEVITAIGRIGGYSAAAVIFDGENGVELTKGNVEKVKDFMYYAAANNLPIITFVNTLGVKADGATNSSTVLKSISNLICALNYATSVPRINVIYGKAIGLGYTLFGSKAYGADYALAFCNAQISSVSSAVGAEMEFVLAGGDKAALKAKFEDIDMDAMNGAKCGYLDNVIEPQFVRQYIISALQMLIG